MLSVMLMDTISATLLVIALLIVPVMVVVNAGLIPRGMRVLAAAARATYNCTVWWGVWYREELGKLREWEMKSREDL